MAKVAEKSERLAILRVLRMGFKWGMELQLDTRMGRILIEVVLAGGALEWNSRWRCYVSKGQKKDICGAWQKDQYYCSKEFM